MRAFSCLYHITGFSRLSPNLNGFSQTFTNESLSTSFQHRTNCDVTNRNLMSCIVLLAFVVFFICECIELKRSKVTAYVKANFSDCI